MKVTNCYFKVVILSTCLQIYFYITIIGPLALYNGLKPTLVRTIPATAVLFVVYEYSKKYMKTIFGDD